MGVWEYPWNGAITNENHSGSDIGVYGDQPGINWSNARAPFFFSKSGFGIYVDTTDYGVFDFSQSGQVKFTFNATTLTYSVIYNTNLTALLMEFAEPLQQDPDAALTQATGPSSGATTLSRTSTAAWPNAQDNYYDVANHLYYNQIRATAMFADRMTAPRPHGEKSSLKSSGRAVRHRQLVLWEL